MIRADYPFLGRVIAYELLDKRDANKIAKAALYLDDKMLKYSIFGFYGNLYLSNGDVLVFAYDIKEPTGDSAVSLDKMRDSLSERGKVVFEEFKRVMMKAGLQEDKIELGKYYE